MHEAFFLGRGMDQVRSATVVSNLLSVTHKFGRAGRTDRVAVAPEKIGILFFQGDQIAHKALAYSFVPRGRGIIGEEDFFPFEG